MMANLQQFVRDVRSTNVTPWHLKIVPHKLQIDNFIEILSKNMPIVSERLAISDVIPNKSMFGQS